MKVPSTKPQVTNHKKQPAWVVPLKLGTWNLRLGTLLCLSLISLFPYFLIPSFAQTATLYGKITDKQGKPIADVKVSVRNTKTSTATSEKGDYELTLPSDTNLTIEFSHVSFGIRLKTVRLAAGEKKKADVSVEASKTLDTFVVEDKYQRSNFIQTIPTKDVFLQAGASQDFNTIIFTQLGVQQSNELSSTYSVRGGNFDENLVYVNDIEVYRPFLVHTGQQEGLSFVNSDLVSSINFSSGGFEARYGDKMSSVLDIRYTHPREFAGSVSGGLLGSAVHLEGASKDKRFTYLVGIREKSNSYLLKSLDTKGDYKPLFYDVQSFITYNPTDEWEHDILLNVARNKFRMIPQSRKSSFGTVNEALQLNVLFDGQEIDDYQTLTGAYSAIYRPHGKDLTLKFITSTFNTRENETFDVLGQYSLNELENDLGSSNFGQSAFNIGTGGFLNHARNYLNATVYNFEHKGNKLWKEKNRQLWWGVKYQHEIINDKLSEWTMIDSAGYSLPHASDSTGYVNPNVQPYQNLELNEIVRAENELSSNRYTGYVQHAWNWEGSPRPKGSKDSLQQGGEFTLTTGVRANYWDVNQQLLISPRATLSFKPKWKHDVLFKASSGYYYQPPFYRELRDFSGTVHKEVKAQQSIHYVLGTDVNYKAWGRPFKLISEIYYKQLDNLIPYEVDNVRLRYYAVNNAKGYATGMDTKVAGEFVKGIDSWMSLSVMKTMYDIKDDSYYIRLNSDGDTIIPGYSHNSVAVDSIRKEPGYLPRPTDQRVTFSMFFQDYLPMLPRCKMHMNLLFGSGLPFGPPTHELWKNVFRMPPYRRVDIGFSYEILKDRRQTTDDNGNEPGVSHPSSVIRHLKSIWFSLEVYNLLAVNNVVSYLWVRDVTGRQYAVPNYLSSRLLNARVMVKF
ncbi:MAG: carboxypeptidase-like regulatory domain-containing protein [Bacteroidetes bacterium]|nr:carboxypeptidase-like regulatory domain-containing protein [Bacteroidota bacterium]